MTKKYWLLKSEPESFSIDDLAKAPRQTTDWGGVRNYQARNYLRDALSVGDEAFYYHSNAEPPGIVGIVTVTRAGYPDETQFDRKSDYYDAQATREAPRWFSVDVTLGRRLDRVVSLATIRATRGLAGMELVKKSRLSVQPVKPEEWRTLLGLIESQR